MSLLNDMGDCDFLRSIPSALIERLDRISRRCDFPPGMTLFKEGQDNRDFHILTEGRVRLEMLVPRRGRIPIMTAGKGDILAWSALIGNSIMTTSATALVPVKTVAIDGEALRALCEEEHDIGFHVMRQLASAVSRRLVATRLQLLDLFAEQVPALDSESSPTKPGELEC